MFELIARLVAYFYSLTSSYGMAILMLTGVVMLVVMPLTFKSTKSMIEMRRIQPQIKRVQTKYAADREKMNQELMALYQKHGVNPVGGCLPVLVQAPVFFVLFRVVRGLTRRTVDTGWASGNALSQRALIDAGVAEGAEVSITLANAPTANFNPEYLKPETEMYQDLTTSNEMVSWGIDLARSASEVIRESLVAAVPFMILVIVTGVLSWYQQRQIQGRSTAEIPQQMQMITKIMPWMAPLFAFTLPAALGVYFIGSALFRVGQNAVISQRFYKGDMQDDVVLDDDDDDDDWVAPEGAQAAPQPGGLLGALMGNTDENAAKNGSAKAGGANAGSSGGHGSRSPVQGNRSSRNRARPPRESTATPASSKSASKSASRSASKSASVPEAEEGGLWARARRSAAEGREQSRNASANGRGKGGSSSQSAVEKKPSKRVTPKGGSSTNRKKK